MKTQQNGSPKRGGNGNGNGGGLQTLVSPLPGVLPEELLIRLAKLGLTNEEVAEVFGITLDQFRLILDKNPNLYDALQDAKEVPNRKVEASLYKRAIGFQTKEVHKVEGKPIKVVIKELAPDVVADIFWLKNRDPKRWRDTFEVTHTLRDRMDRAHQALRMGAVGATPLELPGGTDDSGDTEPN